MCTGRATYTTSERTKSNRDRMMHSQHPTHLGLEEDHAQRALATGQPPSLHRTHRADWLPLNLKIDSDPAARTGSS
jgi:hypothetical protein